MAATIIEKVVAWIGIHFLDPGSQTGLNAVAKVSSSLAQRQSFGRHRRRNHLGAIWKPVCAMILPKDIALKSNCEDSDLSAFLSLWLWENSVHWLQRRIQVSHGP